MIDTISEVARKLNVNPVTIRRWEKKGVCIPAVRTSNGYRIYSPKDVERLLAFAQTRQTSRTS